MAAHVALILTVLSLIQASGQPLLIERERIPVHRNASRLERDGSGRWYVCVPSVHIVVMYPPSKKGPVTAGGYGWTLSAFDRPSSIATDGLNVFVADEGNHRVVRLDKDLRPISALSTRDTSYAPARFGFPKGVAVNSRGQLAILDAEGRQVIVFNTDGRYITRLGQDLPDRKQFADPRDLAIDEQDKFYVLDGWDVRRFDEFGNAIGSLEAIGPSESLGLSVFAGWLAIVSADTLVVSDTEGRLRHAIPRGVLSPGSPLSPLADVGWYDGSLALLADGMIVLYEFDEQ